MSQTKHKSEAEAVAELVDAVSVEPVPEPVEAAAQDIHIVRATLGEPYSGWWFDFDDNFTMGQLDKLSTQKFLDMRQVLLDIVVRWNIKNKQGESIELTGTMEQFKDVSRNLISAMTRALFEETTVPEV